jgi:quercetin dioxygenase-like cupin family protein
MKSIVAKYCILIKMQNSVCIIILKKQKTWYVKSGKFTFKWINTSNADILTEELLPGDIITNNIGEPHQIICNEEGDIFEVSTTHYDEDSYRVIKGDSQNIL